MAKIEVEGKVVELDGDAQEMTRVIWKDIKDRLILPYLDIDLDCYDLGIENRDATDDQKIRRHSRRGRSDQARTCGCQMRPATMTPDEARVEEFGLEKMWKSPNGTIRKHSRWYESPRADCHRRHRVVWCLVGQSRLLLVARHAFGDQSKATDFKVPTLWHSHRDFHPE